MGEGGAFVLGMLGMDDHSGYGYNRGRVWQYNGSGIKVIRVRSCYLVGSYRWRLRESLSDLFVTGGSAFLSESRSEPMASSHEQRISNYQP